MAARLMWRSGGGRGAVRTLQLQRVLGFSTSSAAVGPAGEISAAASSLQSRELIFHNYFRAQCDSSLFSSVLLCGV